MKMQCQLLNKCNLTFLLLCLVAFQLAACCTRAPTHLPHGRRSRGDNGYRLIVAEGANGYVPGETYTGKCLYCRKIKQIQFSGVKNNAINFRALHQFLFIHKTK